MNLRVNEISLELAKKILDCPEIFGAQVIRLQNGATVVDAGVNVRGGFEAGRLITEICLGGLGKAYLTTMGVGDTFFPAVTVETNWPAFSTLCMQAGYPLFENEKTRLISSGPARVLAQKPKRLFDYLNFEDDSAVAVIILQMNELPRMETADAIASVCHVKPENLFMFVTPSGSLAGVTQIAGRAIEDVMFTLWEVLHYDVKKVRHIMGVAPIAPIYKSRELTKALPDDFLAYGGQVYVWLEPDGDEAKRLAEDLVFESTLMCGKTFSELLKKANFDFKKLPGYPDVFRPAQVIINDIKTGEMHRAGTLNLQMLKEFSEFKGRKNRV